MSDASVKQNRQLGLEFQSQLLDVLHTEFQSQLLDVLHSEVFTCRVFLKILAWTMNETA